MNDLLSVMRAHYNPSSRLLTGTVAALLSPVAFATEAGHAEMKIKFTHFASK